MSDKLGRLSPAMLTMVWHIYRSGPIELSPWQRAHFGGGRSAPAGWDIRTANALAARGLVHVRETRHRDRIDSLVVDLTDGGRTLLDCENARAAAHRETAIAAARNAGFEVAFFSGRSRRHG